MTAAVDCAPARPRGRPPARAAGHRRRRALRQPRPRGQRARVGGRRRPRRASCCPTTPACTAARATPRRCARACWRRRATRWARSSARGPTTSSCSAATPPTRSTCWPPRCPARSCASTSSTTPTCCRGGRAAWCPPAPTVAATLTALAAALRARPAALVAVTGASNVTGEVLPIAEVVEIAHAAGARVVLDAAQLAPHRRVDIAGWDVDYVAVSGHKLYAPYGAGALVGRRDWLDAAPPHLAGGGAVTEVGTDTTRWAAAPHRHEGGTPNVVGAAALAKACRTLAPVLDGPGPRARARAARRGWTPGLARVPGVTALRAWDGRGRPGGGAVVHGGRPARGLRRGLPVGRARHRRARRPVLRPPAARPAVRAERGGAAGEHRARHHGRARRPARRRAWSRWSPGARAGRTRRWAAAGRRRPTRARWTRSASAPGAPGRVLSAVGSATPARGRGWRSSTRLPRSS